MTQHPVTHAGVRWSPASKSLRLLKRRVLASLLDLIFPPVCVSCGRAGSLVCSHCLNSFMPPRPGDYPSLECTVSLGIFEGALQKAVHALKYESLAGVGAVLAEPLAEAVRRAGWMPGIITPVPLHASRQRQRGYNQAALLAQPLAAHLGWGYRPDLLTRTRETRSQVGLNHQERQHNVAAAFAVQTSAFVTDQVIVLVDDVLTTGATLGACAQALLAAGARAVRAVTAGQASPDGTRLLT